MAISILVATGFICRHTRRSGFKLAVVVGYSENKMRVRFWRANSKKWTLPTIVDADELTGLNESDYKKHGAAIKHASNVALNLKLVGRVWS